MSSRTAPDLSTHQATHQAAQTGAPGTATSDTPAPAVARWPGWLVFAMALGGFAIGISEFATMSLLPSLAQGLGIDEPTAGQLISAYALGVVVGAPLIALVVARYSRRATLVGLMLFFAVAHLGSMLAPTYTTMMVARFFSGLPHGAYFGVAALVAASLDPGGKRAATVAKMMLGLTVATVLGVPLANALGQSVGWRSSFGLVSMLALLTAGLVGWLAPRDRPDPHASAMRELGALKRRQVWLTLATASIGFAGIFCVYTYLASTMMDVTFAAETAAGRPEVSQRYLQLVLALFGIGMTVGSLVIGHFTDRSVTKTAAWVLLWSAGTLALYPFAAHSIWLLAPLIALIGVGGGLGIPLQTRLMDVSGDAQTLAAALNHSAFNTANALGPIAGGMAIHAGLGWTSTGWVASLLALGGFAIWMLALALDRHDAGKGTRGSGSGH